MAKDTLVLASIDQGTYNYVADEDVTMQYHNTAPLKVGNDQYAIMPRPVFGAVTTTASVDDSTRGRGIADFLGYDLMLCNDDTMYYSGGSLEMFSTQGFAKELMAKYSYYNQAGTGILVCTHAGDTSTLGTNDGAVWYHTANNTAPTQITDVDMPGNNGQSLIRGGASLDGYFFVSDVDGKIQNCTLDDITEWKAINFITAEREADVGVYLGRHHDHLVWIGTRSMEFFYNAGNATGSPLLRRQDVFFNIGCYHPNSVLELGDRIFFVGKNIDGEVGLMMLEDFKITNITNDHAVVDKYVKALEFQTPDLAVADNLQQGVYLATFNSAENGQFLILTLPTGSFSLHLDTSIWAKWYMGSTPTNNGGIADWTNPKVFPIVASLNRSGTNSTAPNRWMLLNGEVSLEQSYAAGSTVSIPLEIADIVGSEWDAITGGPSSTTLSTSEASLHVDPTGTRIYIGANDLIYQYSMSTAYDITTIAYVGVSPALEGGSNKVHPWISSDGTKLIVCERFQMWAYTMSTAWDITSATYDTGETYDFQTDGDGSLWGYQFHVNDDGTKVWIADHNQATADGYIVELTISPAYQLSTAVEAAATVTAGEIVKSVASGREIYGFCFSEDGLYFWLLVWDSGWTYERVYEYIMTSAFDITTATYNNLYMEMVGTQPDTSEGFWCRAPLTTTFIRSGFNSTTTELSTHSWTGGGTAELAIPTDFSGTNPSMHMYTRPWDLDTNERKIVDTMRILHYANAATYAGTSNLGIQWLDTDKANTTGVTDAAFNTVKNVNIATATPKLHRGGQTRQRYFKLTFSGEKTQRVRGLEIDYRPSKG